MKNYNFTHRIPFIPYKWIVISFFFRLKGDTLFKFSIDRKSNGSMPGLYIILSILNIFGIQISIFDERVYDEQSNSLLDSDKQSCHCLTVEQLKSVDPILEDLIRWSPRFDQIFLKHKHVPEAIISDKQQVSYIISEMEKYLRACITLNQ